MDLYCAFVGFMVAMSLLQDVLFKYWLNHLPSIEKVIQSGGGFSFDIYKKEDKNDAHTKELLW